MSLLNKENSLGAEYGEAAMRTLTSPGKSLVNPPTPTTTPLIFAAPTLSPGTANRRRAFGDISKDEFVVPTGGTGRHRKGRTSILVTGSAISLSLSLSSPFIPKLSHI